MLSPGMRQAAAISNTSATRIESEFARITTGGRRMGASVNELRERLEAVNRVRFGTTMQREFDIATRSARQLRQEIERLEGAGEEKKRGGGLLKKAALVAGATAALSFGGKSLRSAMDYGATEQSFQVLTGSRDKGKDLAMQLNKLQQNTILGPEVFKAAQTMMSFGVATDDVVKRQKQLGDIAMGNKDRFEHLSLAFSQTTAAGRLMGQDLLQFVNAGFNPLTVMSEKWQQFGFKQKVGVGELKKMMEDGRISSGMVGKAFELATSEGGKFANMMDVIGDTAYGKLQILEGQFENFKIGVGNALVPAAQGLMNMGTELMNVLNLSKTAPEILFQERAEITNLVQSITSLNEGNSLRQHMLKMLVAKYPDLFKNIDIECVKNKELLDTLDKVNVAYGQRINLASVDLQQSDAAKNKKDLLDMAARVKAQIDYNETAGRQGFGSMFFPKYMSFKDKVAVDMGEYSDIKSKGGLPAVLDKIMQQANDWQKEEDRFSGTKRDYERQLLLTDAAHKLTTLNSDKKTRHGKESMALDKTLSEIRNKHYTGKQIANSEWDNLKALVNPITATAANDMFTDGNKDGGKEKLKSAKGRSDGINNGGQRSIVINIGKQIEKIENHIIGGGKEVADEIEKHTREAIRRVFYSINNVAS